MNKKAEVEQFLHVLHTIFDGVFTHGSHSYFWHGGCVNEVLNYSLGMGMSDQTDRVPDLRLFNDSPWTNDQARTDAILPLIISLWDWAEWGDERRMWWTRRVCYIERGARCTRRHW